MSDAVAEGINAHLEQENERLRNELAYVRSMLAKPVNVNVQSPDAGTLRMIEQYLPQLTHIATNLSHVASNLTTVTATLDRIAKAVEAKP